MSLEPYATHSALDPAGIQAVRIRDLFWGFGVVSLLVFVLVLGAFACAIGTRRNATSEPHRHPPGEEGRKERWMTAAVLGTIAALVGLLVASVGTGRALAALTPDDAVVVHVVGHKWWWEFRYPVTQGATEFTTAYEMHVPVGRPIVVDLASHDVIHSFWVPSLHGKRDLIPGKETTLVLRADEPGVYEGMCAEFCGPQHANMHFLVVAETPERYAAWLSHQLTPAKAPADAMTQRGKEVFENARCSACHAISGTSAFATVGPDLTHVASRKRLAMGVVENMPGHLAGWIADPQSIKPGVIMPGSIFAPADQQALVAYLETLQ